MGSHGVGHHWATQQQQLRYKDLSCAVASWKAQRKGLQKVLQKYKRETLLLHLWSACNLYVKPSWWGPLFSQQPLVCYCFRCLPLDSWGFWLLGLHLRRKWKALHEPKTYNIWHSFLDYQKPFSSILMVFSIFSPALSKYNWHTILCKFKVCGFGHTDTN